MGAAVLATVVTFFVLRTVLSTLSVRARGARSDHRAPCGRGVVLRLVLADRAARTEAMARVPARPSVVGGVGGLDRRARCWSASPRSTAKASRPHSSTKRCCRSGPAWVPGSGGTARPARCARGRAVDDLQARPAHPAQGVPVDRSRAPDGHLGRVPGQRRCARCKRQTSSRCTAGRAGRARRSSCRSPSATGRAARRSLPSSAHRGATRSARCTCSSCVHNCSGRSPARCAGRRTPAGRRRPVRRIRRVAALKP